MKTIDDLIQQIELLKDFKLGKVDMPTLPRLQGLELPTMEFPEDLRELLKEVIYQIKQQKERIEELEKQNNELQNQIIQKPFSGQRRYLCQTVAIQRRT